MVEEFYKLHIRHTLHKKLDTLTICYITVKQATKQIATYLLLYNMWLQ
jgi:hypothetical protein